LCMPLAVVSLHYASYAQTAEKKAMSVILPVVDGMLGVVLCSFLLISAMKMNGLYVSNVLNGVICAIVITAGAWIALKPGDMGKNVGIRLVYRMAETVSYQNLLGMNVLTMHI